jgi:hypothetical protein
MNTTEHIQVVTFQLAGLEPDAYRAHCEAAAPAFTEIPGLLAKAWLADPSTNTYGGVHLGAPGGDGVLYQRSDLRCAAREPGGGPRDDTRLRRPRAADAGHAPPVNGPPTPQPPAAGRHQRGSVDSPRSR